MGKGWQRTGRARQFPVDRHKAIIQACLHLGFNWLAQCGYLVKHQHTVAVWPGGREVHRSGGSSLALTYQRTLKVGNHTLSHSGVSRTADKLS